MKRCPKHIESSVVGADELIEGVIDEDADSFLLKCTCGSYAFHLFEGDKRSVVAQCLKCDSRIVVYDLVFYPSATKVKGEEIFQPFPGMDRLGDGVYLVYEYGEFDEGDEFDQNDITWCQIFVMQAGGLKKVFDDETA